MNRKQVEAMYARGEIDYEIYTLFLLACDYHERLERERLAEMETTLADVDAPRDVPMPGDCHPAYADKKDWIVRWLDDQPDNWRLLLPVPRRRAFMIPADQLGPTEADMPRIEALTRRKCAGNAPYVGRPFHYEWFVAEDSYGRHVAADARLVHH